MHYIAILIFIGFVTLATGGHSATFGKAYEAIVRGDIDRAVGLFTTALRNTLEDADVSPADCDPNSKIVLVGSADYSGAADRCD